MSVIEPEDLTRRLHTTPELEKTGDVRRWKTDSSYRQTNPGTKSFEEET